MGGTKILQNEISLLKDGTGIYISNLIGNLLNKSLMANNFISVKSVNNAVGIRAYNNSSIDIYYNNIRVQSLLPENDYAFDYYNYDNSGLDNVSILNNIFANYGGTHAATYRSTTGIANCDYNNLYSSGDKLVYMSEDYNTIEAWRTASNLDIHSLSLDPLYYSDFDLHVQQLALDSVGISVPNVDIDIDETIRNSSYPDIGADEFEPLLSDIGIIGIEPNSGCELSIDEEVLVTVQNYSIQSQTGFELTYILNDSISITETFNDTILPGKTSKYVFSELADLSKISVHQFKVYTDLIGDQNRYNDTLLYEVTNLPKFKISVTKDTSICMGSSIYISASSAKNYLWSTGQTYSSINVSPSVDTYYGVTATNGLGCVDSDSVQIKIRSLPETPVVTATGATEFCYGDSVILTSSIVENIKWKNGLANPTRTIFNTGHYYVMHTDSTGCSAKSNVVSVYEEPKAHIASLPYTSICSGDSIKLSIENGLTYTWSTGEITKSIYVSPMIPTTYSVTITTPVGCSYIDEVTIDVISSIEPGVVTEMLPFDGADELSIPLDLSWSPVSDATHYDVYIWPVDQPKPLNPAIRNLSSIRYKLYAGIIEYGGSYKWQVVSKYYGCQETQGAIQEFAIRHLPDVIVTDVQIPESVFAGETIDITWEVTNQGEGNTVHQHWVDRIYLSVDSIFDPSFVLGSVSNMTYLEPGQSYSKTASFKLPYNLDGNLYVFILADNNNTLLESDNENNKKSASEPLWIKINPPPDLFVNKIIVPKNVFSEQICDITWQIINKGYKTAKPGKWYDEVYISKSYNTAKRYKLGKFLHTGELDPDSTYSITKSVKLPIGIYGKHYFYVRTDLENKVYEHAYDGNNVGQSDSVNVILTPPPDLVVTSIKVPDSATNKSIIPIEWTVLNQGAASPSAKNWIDKIYLSSSPDTNLVGSYTYYQYRRQPSGLKAGLSYNVNKNIKIPDLIEPGRYYFYIKTDDTDEVFEYVNDSNNISRSDSIMIGIADWPDLQITSIQVPDSASTSEEIMLNYTLRNFGSADAITDIRKDRVAISLSKYTKSVFIKDIVYNAQKIAAGDSIICSHPITLPSGLKWGSGDYYLFVEADTEDNIYEHTNENNNVDSTDIYILPADRAILSINVPDSVYAGETLSFNWQVQNIGRAQTALTKWLESYKIYRTSNKSGFNTKPFEKRGPYKPGSGYSSGVSYRIPHGVSGIFEVEAYTGPDKNDPDKDNNRIISDTVNIILRDGPDLIVQDITIPDTAIAGQPVPLSWTVSNLGLGNTISGGWNDGIYLSSNPYLDIYIDKKIGVSNRLGNLNAGGSYTQNEVVDLPIWANGYYYIIIKTDYLSIMTNYGREYEHLAEHNNTKVIYMKIVQPPPSDLVVDSIWIPDSAITGDTISIDWRLTNHGPNKSQGKMTDMVYFSRDMEWDINDVFVGEVPLDTTINLGETINVNLTTELKGTSVGDYYVIVKTDNRNNIYEVNDNNNSLSSSEVLNVEVQQIYLNELVETTLENNESIYYRIEIPDSLDGKTLLTTLTGDSIFGANELYMRYGDVPTRVIYDYAHSNSFCGNQEVIDPIIKQGTYYFLIYGTTSNGVKQDISLVSQLLNFSVRKIQADCGGNTGKVTVEINGARFSDSTLFQLESGDIIIPSDTMIYINPTKVFITFNLKDSEIGVYDVVAEDRDEIAKLEGGFEVVEGTPYGLVTFMNHPSSVVLGNIFSIKVQYANEGNIDIPIKERIILSVSGAPVSYTVRDIDGSPAQLEMIFTEPNGPQHILRPGAIGSVIVFSRGIRLGGQRYKIKRQEVNYNIEVEEE